MDRKTSTDLFDDDDVRAAVGIAQRAQRGARACAIEALARRRAVGQTDSTLASQTSRPVRPAADDDGGQRRAGPPGQSQARCTSDARAWAAKPQASAIPRGDDGLQARAPGGAQRSGARF